MRSGAKRQAETARLRGTVSNVINSFATRFAGRSVNECLFKMLKAQQEQKEETTKADAKKTMTKDAANTSGRPSGALTPTRRTHSIGGPSSRPESSFVEDSMLEDGFDQATADRTREREEMAGFVEGIMEVRVYERKYPVEEQQGANRQGRAHLKIRRTRATRFAPLVANTALTS